MDRSLTHGYNEMMSVAEYVLSRRVRAAFDAGSIRDWAIISTDSDTVDILFDNPGVRLEATQADRHATLDIDVLVARERGSPLSTNGSVSVEVTLETNQDPESDEEESDEDSEDTLQLLPRFDAVTDADVTMNLPGAPPNARDAIVQYIRNDLSPDNFAIPLQLPKGRIKSDLADFKIIEGTDPGETNALSLGLYSRQAGADGTSGDNPTRGNADDLTSILGPDESFTVAISAASFDEMMDRFIKQRWLRVEIEVGEEEASEVEITQNAVAVSPPDEDGFVTVSSPAGSKHEDVRGNIRNLRTDQQVGLSTDEDGAFSVRIAAEVGDVLRLHGDYIRGKNDDGDESKVFVPNIRLADGHISIEGEAIAIDAFLGIDFSADYSAQVRLAIDPATGEVIPIDIRTEGDIGVGWYFLMAIIIGIVAGVVTIVVTLIIQDIVQEMVEDESRRAIGDLFEEADLDLTRGIEEARRIVAFPERIDITARGITIGGQLETGRIHHHGRMLAVPSASGILVALERIERPTWFVVRPDGTIRASGFGRADIVEFMGTDFEGVDARLIDARATSGSPIPATTRSGERAFGIRTADGRMAKVRLGPEPFVVRFVTYAAPLVPSVTLNGELSASGRPDAPGRAGLTAPATSYRGSYSAEPNDDRLAFDRRRRDPPLTFEWELTGDGRILVTTDRRTDDSCQFAVTAEELGLSRPLSVDEILERFRSGGLITESESNSQRLFSALLRVTVTDVFGRSATDATRLSGKIGYVGVDFDEFIDIDIPEDLLPPGGRGPWP